MPYTIKKTANISGAKESVNYKQNDSMRVFREGTARFMPKNFGKSTVITEVMFDAGLFRGDVARKVLIRDEYHVQCQQGKKTDLKYQLAEKYPPIYPQKENRPLYPSKEGGFMNLK